tara:strand:- start:1480 stop:2727 length:1248 start_codon:yes stop_codon:yes gene_type:complete
MDEKHNFKFIQETADRYVGLPYINYAVKLIEQTKLYNNVFRININWCRWTNISDQIKTFKPQIKKQDRTCFVLQYDEPACFLPESKIGLEVIELVHALRDNNLYGCDFLLLNFYENSTLAHINFLNKNFYGWHFASIDCQAPELFEWSIAESEENALTTNDNLNLETCKYNISYLNFTQRTHRELFSKFLIKENLVKNNLIAINKVTDVVDDNTYRYRGRGIKHWINRFKKEIEPTRKSWNNFESWFLNPKLLAIMRDVKLEYSKHPDINHKYDHINLDFLSKAVLNITSETVFYYPYVEFSEKIVQPIIAKRPFVLIGPAHSLKYMRSKGFKTFGKIIDESYDELDDPNERMESIMNVVKKFNQNSVDQNKELLLAIKDELIHNEVLMVKQIKNLQKNIGKGIIQYVNNRKNFN